MAIGFIVVVLATSGAIAISQGSGDPDPPAPRTAATPVTTSTSAIEPTVADESAQIESDILWQSGACVREVGSTVEIASCTSSHDGEIVARVASEGLCPADTTHTVDLEADVACLRMDAYGATVGFDASTCTFDGTPLYGGVYFSESIIGADMVIAASSSAITADLTVVEVTSQFTANGCGLWYVVESLFPADFSVAVSDSPITADFTVYVGSSPFEAGTN